MDKNVSKPGKRHDFPGSAIAAPGENLFDESRIHAAFAEGLDTPDQAIQGGSS